ncbi:hypothetical protein PGC35_07020 [Psychrobacillus sp. PGGUH221]|uniref:hypothetical protein n=1 Tax=Psychrobacillus sp. PGGUH221 TaxID=3020058 RepID=UPI0035C738DB
MELSNIDNIETDKIENLSFLLFIWSEYGNSNEASTTITRKIENDQYFVFSLLDTFTPTAFGEFGVKKSGFRRNNYDAIKNLVDPLVIVDAIEKVFYPEYLEVPRDEELARQFLWIHNNLLNEEANEHEQEKEL